MPQDQPQLRPAAAAAEALPGAGGGAGLQQLAGGAQGGASAPGRRRPCTASPIIGIGPRGIVGEKNPSSYLLLMPEWASLATLSLKGILLKSLKIGQSLVFL